MHVTQYQMSMLKTYKGLLVECFMHQQQRGKFRLVVVVYTTSAAATEQMNHEQMG